VGVPDFFNFDNWQELGYRSRNIMIGMQIVFEIVGIGLTVFGILLFRRSQKNRIALPKIYKYTDVPLFSGSSDVKAVTYHEISIIFLILIILFDLLRIILD